jgi:uncharacterized tellurite resistance protein B-like protein
MSITSLSGILKIFGGSQPTAEEQAELAKAVMLMTLARATSSDTNIKAIEVEKVREVLKARTGEDVPAADVRVAANSKLFEDAPLDKYLASSAKQMRSADRVATAHALAEVINADGRVSDREIDFFNSVADSLSLTPAQLMGLHADDPLHQDR